MNKTWRYLGQFLVSLAILYGLWRRLDRDLIAGQWHAADPGRLVLAFSFHFLALGVSLIRWRLLLRPLGISLSWFAVGWVYMMGGFFNSFLPTSIGGDAVRILKTAEWSGRRAEAAASVVVERWTGMIAFLCFCLAAIALGAYPYLGLRNTLLTFFFALGLMFGLAGLMRRLGDPDRAAGGGLARKIRRKWRRFREAMTGYREHPRSFWWAMAWAFVVQGILIVYYVVLAWSLGMGGRWSGYAVVVPLSELVSMVPVSLGGFGTREAAFIGMAGVIGLAPEQAFLLAFARGILGLGFNLLGVVTLWFPYRPAGSTVSPPPTS